VRARMCMSALISVLVSMMACRMCKIMINESRCVGQRWCVHLRISSNIQLPNSLCLCVCLRTSRFRTPPQAATLCRRRGFPHGVGVRHEARAEPKPRMAARPQGPGKAAFSQDRFAHAGWEFRSVSAPISGVHKLLALGRQLSSPYADNEGDGAPLPFCVHGATRSLKPCTCGSALVMGVRMHMPDAVFGDNVLQLRHAASGVVVNFGALDALRARARDSVEQGSRSVKAPPARLPQWEERMRSARRATSTDVDWTFCCHDYIGEVHRAEAEAGGAEAPQAPRVAPPRAGPMGLIDTSAPVRRVGGAKGGGVKGAGCGDGGCDGGGKGEGEGSRSEGAAAAAAAAAMAAEWVSCSGETLDPTGEAGRMLRAPEPILWSAVLPSNPSPSPSPSP
jgi:hypothetical protein